MSAIIDDLAVKRVTERSPVRVLFVDDEDMVLRMLRAAVSSMGQEWAASFAGSGPDALALLAKESFDMIVSDMRMPGMNGAELLNQVFKLYPATFRVILTGFVEQESVMESIGTAHQFLAKPFQLDLLKELLRRARSLKERLGSPEVRLIISRTACVPSVPDIYFKILDALQVPECPVQRIAEIATTDPGLTSKLLQLVNSAFFGFASPVSNASEAVMLLGTSTIRSLALTCRVFSAFKVEPALASSLEHIWPHCLRVARTAERIARLEHSNNVVAEQAFTAGLLHDIGKLILANALGAQYLSVLRRGTVEKTPLTESERRTFGATHSEVGASLLQLWGLPTPLIEAVLSHEKPAELAENSFSPAIAVHVANALDHETYPPPGVASGLDLAYLERLNLTSKIESWRQHLSAI